MQRKVRGSILLGIALTALAGGLLGYGRAPKAIAAIPSRVTTRGRRSPSISTSGESFERASSRFS